MFFTLSLLIITLPSLSLPQDISSLVDVKTLSELPLNKLIQVKNTFTPSEIDDEDSSESSPQALALQGKYKPNDRGGYHGHGQSHVYEEEYSKKSGKKSVQSIFQLSVTTLAFLAFGGYLLCLLVQALQAKNMDMTVVNTQTMAALLQPKPIRRRRPTARPPRYQRPVPRPNARPKRDVWPEANQENMYFVLLSLSEAYANYHTIDYRRFNFSSTYFN